MGARAARAGGELTAALEAALVRELRAAWRHLNETHFRSAMRPPTLELSPHRTMLGRWIVSTRTLEISLPMVVEQPWASVIEVLKHEMAHQYVHEVLGEDDQSPHGPAFRDACARLGVDPRASGLPHAPATTVRDEAEDRVVARITRLLALAESPNRHEAEAAMAAAQRLMLKHNLDVAGSREARDYLFSHLGRPSGRIGEHERLVAMILGEHFFVEAIWIPVYRPLAGKRGSVLEICGTRNNLAIAEYVHAFLHETGERLWRDHKRSAGIASDRDRRAYLAGVMVGFTDQLARQKARNRSEGLVWVKDGDLTSYFRRRHPLVRHVRHAGNRRTEAWAHGREAGRKIVLHRPVGAAPVSRGRLLTGKS
ncbi:MAG: SprT-like domain-containing protein [Polyangiaceae bacterium]